MIDYVNSATQRRLPPRAEIQVALNLIPAHAWYAAPSGALTFLNERGADYVGLPKDHPREVVDTIPAIVWSAIPDGSNSYVNSRYVEYCGMPPDQIAGSGWQAVAHPDDLERHKAEWLACVASGEPCEDEVRFRRADGQYRWHLQRGVPLRDETGNIVKWYGVLTDIEDLKRAEDKIREQETELRQMLDFAPQLIAVYGPDRERLYANRVALDYAGLDINEWRQTEARGAFVHPDDREQELAYFARARSDGSVGQLELRLRGGD